MTHVRSFLVRLITAARDLGARVRWVGKHAATFAELPEGAVARTRSGHATLHKRGTKFAWLVNNNCVRDAAQYDVPILVEGFDRSCGPWLILGVERDYAKAFEIASGQRLEEVVAAAASVPARFKSPDLTSLGGAR